jgi:hypothetical protein
MSVYSWNPFYNKIKTFSDKQILLDISHLPLDKQTVLNQVTGFFGMLGPDIKTTKVKTLFEMFTGDGIINGVFFDKGNLTYVKHLIQTEKIQHETKYGISSKNPIIMLINMILHKHGLTPNPMGVANTAFMETSNRVFALFERDLPYELLIDFSKKTIKTLGKIKTPVIQYFSGHSRFENDLVKTLAYKVVEKRVEYREFDEEFILKRSLNFQTNYLPIIHDFITTESNTVLFTDAPFKFSGSMTNPAVFDKNQNTTFHIEKRNLRYKIDTNESFYIFHYGQVNETPSTLEFYASTYENIDFSKIDICGKYRRFNICLRTGKVVIDKNPDLEQYNLDFTVNYGKYTILRSLDMKNRRINGFFICDGLEICDRFLFDDLSFCGEPALLNSEIGQTHLTAFAYRKGKNYLIMIPLLEKSEFDRDIIEIPVDEKIGIGFHSTFLQQ